MSTFNCNTNVNTTGLVDLSEGWNDCTWAVNYLSPTPANMFDASSASNYEDAWLNQASIDNITVFINFSGAEKGTLGIYGGESSAPSSKGLAAKASLEAKGWTVTTN